MVQTAGQRSHRKVAEKMAAAQFLLLFLFPALSSSSLFSPSEATTVSETDCFAEFQELKLKISHFESKLEETIRNLDEKRLHIEEQEKLIQQMSHEINFLQSSVSNLRSDSSGAKERINALEEEVQRLWAASRKNNFDIHVLESNAKDAEKRLKAVASQAEKMADIVTEHWLQIQRLEQALHMTQMRALRVRRKVMYSRCSFLKFIDRLFGDHPQKVLSILDLFILQLKRVFTAVTQYHHELQRYIKKEMEKNEFTAPLANWELVFFLASALIAFPLISAWMLLSSQLH